LRRPNLAVDVFLALVTPKPRKIWLENHDLSADTLVSLQASIPTPMLKNQHTFYQPPPGYMY
jgi:hypothetical protein